MLLTFTYYLYPLHVYYSSFALISPFPIYIYTISVLSTQTLHIRAPSQEKSGREEIASEIVTLINYHVLEIALSGRGCTKKTPRKWEQIIYIINVTSVENNSDVVFHLSPLLEFLFISLFFLYFFFWLNWAPVWAPRIRCNIMMKRMSASITHPVRRIERINTWIISTR